MSNNISNPHASFADDSSATFLIRWRGRQEGPFTAAVIEAKLAANQIGLLHEISHNGQWLTLRDYLAEREMPPRPSANAPRCSKLKSPAVPAFVAAQFL